MAAFNEESTIAKVIVVASQHVNAVLVIDDGSQDCTATIAEKLGAQVIKHDRNLGKGACLADGFKWARGESYDVLVTLDADGQHDPDDIPRLIQPILNHEADIVVGGRVQRPVSMPKLRRVGQKFLDNIARVKSRGSLVDSQSGFRAYSIKALQVVDITEPGMGAESEIIMKAAKSGLDIVEVPVVMYYGWGRTSKMNPYIQFSDVVAAVFKEVLARRPLRFVGLPGLLLVAYGVYGWVEIFATYNTTNEFAVGHALVYTAVLLSGIFITTAGIVLFVIRLMVQEIGKK
jgi:glycosyltransferase involved in cell wall biosynthesis